MLTLSSVLSRGHKVSHCIVVRHLSPPQGLTRSGSSDFDEDIYRSVGKRPSRRLEVRLMFNRLCPCRSLMVRVSKLLFAGVYLFTNFRYTCTLF